MNAPVIRNQHDGEGAADRGRRLLPVGRSVVQAVLERLGGREGQLALSRDLDGRTRGRVAAFAGGDFLDLELAEVRQGDFITGLGGSGHRFDQSVQHLAGIGLARVGGGGDMIDQIGNLHGTILLHSGLCPLPLPLRGNHGGIKPAGRVR
ncbi:hypothetical protein S101468_02634 [Acetobacter pasteurianus subsp. pasteurianus]|uniref:Uncharacterized protein n=1 Tax=Acetobacter pasteurianus subsp. pasteurianus TaxID=481145 RepID=A0AAC9SQS3_ACEPA|nr:hypothetical protein S101468_02634 [Acetobacter pasteurianus subsp. pasteurianus]